MQPGPELRLGEPPAPKPHGQAVPTLVGDRLLERPNDGWIELGRGKAGAVSPLFNSCLSSKAGREFLKPTIWVSPSRVVALGGSVTIRCEGRYRSMEFFLRKAGHPNPQGQSVPDGTVAEFPIPRVGREDGGSYTCDYRSITDQNSWSYPSDPVELIVAGEAPGSAYPKPSISLSPSGGVSLGGAVAVRCWGQYRGVRFVLNKERRHFPLVDSDGFGALFPISNVRREDGGSYSCSYHSRSEPFAVSYPSDPVELVVRGEGPGSASPFPPHSQPHPPGGIYSNPQPDPHGPGLGGCPGLALTACLLCADPSLPRPSISLSPTWVTAPGADATIRCQGQRRDVRFFLHKAGDLNPQRHMDPAGAGAEFHIPTVGRQHGGSYSCSYRPQSEPFISSYASSYVELVVAGEGPGSTSPLPAPHPAGSSGELCTEWMLRFPIHSVSRGDAGSYSCRYSTKSNAPVWSEPSDPVELVVAGEGPGSASPLPSAHPDGPSGDLALVGSSEPGSVTDTWGGVCVSPSHSCLCVNTELPAPRPSISVRPSWVITPGGAVTIRCQCQCEARRLFLYKGGIEIRELDAAGDGGEFTIPSARRDDGGAYSCRSRSRSEPPNWSDPSDIVRIITYYPKPIIFLSPTGEVALGGAVTVQCWGWHQNMRFRLYKDGNPTALQDAEPAGDLAEFPIRNVSRRDAGSYSCSYQDKLYLFNWSHPSDPVELVVAGEGPGSVSPAPPPAGPSGAGTCARGTRGAGAPRVRGPQQPPASQLFGGGGGRGKRSGAEPRGAPYPSPEAPMGGGQPVDLFQLIQTLTGPVHGLNWGRRRRGGGVSPRFNSCLSSKAGREFLKPTISVSPSRVVALGGSVTIRCQGWHPGRTFLLHKVGHLNLQNRTVPDGTVAEFPIPSVGREAGGNYTCDYHSIAEPNRWSGLSDPVEIIVTEMSPKPALSLSPGRATALGQDVTVRCRAGRRDARFSLFKVGDRTPLGRAEPAGAGGEFLTRSVRRGDGGSYTCYYHYATDPCTWSEPSDPVELVVAGEGTGSVSEPHPGRSSSRWRFGAEGGGIPAPRGSCGAGDLSQGDAPSGCPVQGTHRGVGAQGLPSRHHPSHTNPPHTHPGRALMIDAKSRGRGRGCGNLCPRFFSSTSSALRHVVFGRPRFRLPSSVHLIATLVMESVL
uniref:Ig-like domain-containing protein n=1 Tax=Chelydra serpentina TaxID=8475 RepID=A0A8C3SV44_CHESE